MYLVTTNRYSRRNPPKTHAIDIHDLPIPGCPHRASELGGPDLLKECRRLRVPEVAAHMGHQELAVRLATYLNEQEPAK